MSVDVAWFPDFGHIVADIFNRIKGELGNTNFLNGPYVPFTKKLFFYSQYKILYSNMGFEMSPSCKY